MGWAEKKSFWMVVEEDDSGGVWCVGEREWIFYIYSYISVWGKGDMKRYFVERLARDGRWCGQNRKNDRQSSRKVCVWGKMHVCYV